MIRPRIKGRVVYFKGDACKLTGKSVVIYGGLFYDAVPLEGLREGQTVVISARYLRDAVAAEGAKAQGTEPHVYGDGSADPYPNNRGRRS